MNDIIEFFEVKEGVYYYKNKKLNETFNSQGYSRLIINGKAIRTHRLVANKYIPNPNNYKVVDHIDFNKSNNTVENLMWITHSENSKRAYSKIKSMSNMNKKKFRRVIISEKDGVITEHESLRKCGEYLERNVAAVYRCLQGEWNKCNQHSLYYK